MATAATIFRPYSSSDSLRSPILDAAHKETLLRNVGMGGIPTIKIEDADYGQNRVLYLKHYHDGRDLQLEYAERTLAYLERLWGYETILETTVNGTDMILSYNDKGFTTRLR